MIRAFVLLAMVGCSSPPQVEVEPKGTVDVTPLEKDWGRDWRRMDLDQLKASIERVSGGVEWSSPNGRDSINMFDELSETLGKPDYITSTYEDLEPSLLFQKFLKDAANSVCQGVIDEELRRSPAERQFLTEVDPNDTWQAQPEKVKANLSRLILKFHGRVVSPDAPEMEEWTWLFRSVLHVTEDDTHKAWNTVCVALMTHPDFYMY